MNEIFNFIKKNAYWFFIIAMLGAIIFLMPSCKMSQPKLEDYPDTMSDIEIKLTFKYDKCVYAQSFNDKIDYRCNDILNDNQKIEYILFYYLLKEEKKLPIIYRKNGNEQMTFDDFFKYIK